MGDFYNRGGGALTTTIVTTDDLEVDSGTLSVDADNNRVGIGTTAPGTTLQLSSTTTALTLQNSTSENTDGGCESIILFEDHADVSLATIQGSHDGSSDDTKGDLIFSTHTGSALTEAMRIDSAQQATFAGNVVVAGTTPKITIGDAGAEDTMLAFDGAAIDFRIGLDDGTDSLEIGVGVAHGTTTALRVSSLGFIKEAVLDAATADTTYSGISAQMVAGEDLEDGECVYAKSDGKMWKAVATAAATSRTVAMCTADVSADAVGNFLLQGFAHFATNFPSYTVGGVIFTPEAEASGKNVPEQAAPDTDGDFVQVIGWAVSANILYFNPSNDVIEVA